MTKKIFLRAFEFNDYQLINQWRNNMNIQKLVVGPYRYVSSEMEKKWVESKMMNNVSEVYWAICLNDDTKKMIGYTSINNIDYINRKVHGGGIVIGNYKYRDGTMFKQASDIVKSYVFDTLNMNRYTGSCLANHIDSRVMLESFGMILEGIQRKAVYKWGAYRDLCLYSILRSEYYIQKENPLTELEYARKIKRIRDKYRKK